MSSIILIAIGIIIIGGIILYIKRDKKSITLPTENGISVTQPLCKFYSLSLINTSDKGYIAYIGCDGHTYGSPILGIDTKICAKKILYSTNIAPKEMELCK